MTHPDPDELAAELGLLPGEIDAFSVHQFVEELRAEMDLHSPSGDPENWQRDLQDEVAALAVDQDALRAALDEITGVGHQGLATVEVDAVGGFAGLRFRGNNPAADLDGLNADIAEALALARADARRQRVAAMTGAGVREGDDE